MESTPIAAPSRPNFTQSHHHAAAQKKKLPTQDNWKSIISTVAILLIAPLFAIFLIAFVFQSYLVDGPSMESTLQNRDRLVVWKVPRTWSRITGNPYIPKRGDIVVFSEPKLEAYGESPRKQLIKRVVALPGERVTVKDDVLTVYNDEHPDGFQPDATLPYGDVITDTPGNVDVRIPEDHVYVVGDNRHNSVDSRFWGFVPEDHVVGKAVLIWFSSDPETGIRWSRIFKTIE